MKPLLSGKDMDLDITMEEFYEKSQVDLHLYTTETTQFELVSLSHTSHPNWKLLDALYASAGLPVFVAPYIVDNKAYVDGGIFLNYPLKQCMEMENVQGDEILGIQKECVYSMGDEINESSNMLDYVLILLNKVLIRINQDSENSGLIQHEIVIKSSPICASDLYQFSISEECRQNWVKEGTECGKRFLAKYKDNFGSLSESIHIKM